MYEISVSGRFVAEHQLPLAGGGYEVSHAHDWRVRAAFVGPNLDKHGMLMDFHEIQVRLNELLAIFYDRDLNRLPAFHDIPPSAENVARRIAEHVGGLLPDGVRLRYVEVEEAPGCLARFYPG